MDEASREGLRLVVVVVVVQLSCKSDVRWGLCVVLFFFWLLLFMLFVFVLLYAVS